MKTFATLAPLVAGLLLTFSVAAQDHSRHQKPVPAAPDHSRHQATPTAKSKPKPKATPATKPEPRTAEPGTAMDHTAMHHTLPGPANQLVTPIPVLTDADRAAAVPPPSDHPVHDNTIQYFALLNRLEGFDSDAGAGMEWQGQGWVGTDLNKLWLRGEGERVGGRIESADLEVLYGRAFARWWDAVAGVRHDFEPGASQDFAAIGVHGLAPYKFEVAATAYLGQSGQSAARVEAEYETLLTNRLILQPLVELNIYGKNDERRGIGSGLSTAETGVRLRYEFTRQFAPYIGVVHERAFGRTADLRREGGEGVNDTRFVAGIRIWF